MLNSRGTLPYSHTDQENDPHIQDVYLRGNPCGDLKLTNISFPLQLNIFFFSTENVSKLNISQERAEKVIDFKTRAPREFIMPVKSCTRFLS